MSEASSDSESCPSFATESESEQEYNWAEEKDQREVDYTATAKEIICENVNITTENALKLNSGYHNMLKVLKNKLEILLGQCQERQVEITKQIEDYKNNRKPLVGKSRTSGYICGQPYFKDEELYPGPHNEDYLYRKKTLKEFFPLDLATATNWTTKDKVNILKGVKKQIVEFIEREIRLKIKKLGNGLEAERLRLEMVSLKRREVPDLWERVKHFSNDYPGQKFEVDWLRISNVDIGERHTWAACVALWNNYMLPGLVRSGWQPEEETALLEAVERNGRQDWAQIAMAVPGRSAYQCFVHFQTTFSELAQIKRERWTAEEDALLVRVVDENRIGSNIIWNKVVEKMPLRNKIQCYNRYMFTLMRPTKHAKFTAEEDCIIQAYVQQHGHDFRFFPPNLLPGRTNRQIWARYNHTLKYVSKHAGWTIEEDERLMQFIKENLTDEGPKKISWAACSKALGNHSRLSCRTRYYTIEKFLEKNPDATLDDVPRKGKKLSTSVTDENWMKTYVKIRNESNEPAPPESATTVAVPLVQEEQPSTSGAGGGGKGQKKPRRDRRKPISEWKPPRLFVDTIKCAIRRKIYHKFKYSFHYRLGDQTPDIQNTKVFCLNKVALQLLNCTTNFDRLGDHLEDNFTANEGMLLRSSFSIKLHPGLTCFLDDTKNCFLFPPSYNTMLGVRGIVLNATYPPDPKASPIVETVRLDEEDEAGYHYSLDTFRDRFRMMFYWSMLLAQQNPGEAIFVEADEQPKSEYRLPDLYFDHEQVALAQLTKLCGNGRQMVKQDDPTPIPQPLTPTIEEATTSMGRMDLAPPHSSIVKAEHGGNNFHESLPTSSKVQIIAIKRITNSSMEPISIEQFNDPSPPTEIAAQPSPPSYQLAYSLPPNQAPVFQPNTMVHDRPPIPIADDKLPPGAMELVGQITIINPEDLPAVKVATTTESAELDVRAVPTPVAVNVGSAIAEVNQPSEDLYRQQEERFSKRDGDNEDDHDVAADTEYGAPSSLIHHMRKELARKIEEVKHQRDLAIDETTTATTQHETPIAEPTSTIDAINDDANKNVEPPEDNAAMDFEDSIPLNVVVPQNLPAQQSVASLDSTVPSSEDVRSETTMATSAAMDTSEDHYQPSGNGTDANESNNSASMDDSGSDIMAAWSEENSVELETISTDVNKPVKVKSSTNVGEFVIEELHEPEQGSECSSPEKSANLDDSYENVHEEKPAQLSAQLLDDNVREVKSTEKISPSLDDLDWNPEVLEAPKRTYGRTKKPMASRYSDQSSKVTVLDSHAWRWVHVDESDDEDVGLHQDLWEFCDPFRIQLAGCSTNPAESVEVEPSSKKDEVIVIDDDEVEIKEEPKDVDESQTDNQMDQALQIQQIIETASSILRISEEFKIPFPHNVGHPSSVAVKPPLALPPVVPSSPQVEFEPYADTGHPSSVVFEPPQPLPPAIPPSPQVEFEPYADTDSLIVQTPSRVFDEQSNCYYYVDEIHDGTAPPQLTPNLPTTYWIYNGEGDDSQISQPESVSVLPVQTTQPVPVPTPDPQLPSSSKVITFQQTLDKIRTYACSRNKLAKEQPSKDKPIVNVPAQSKSSKMETLLQLPESPSIRKPKRPPRESTKISPQRQHAVQTQALSLLDALFTQPKLKPLPRRTPTSSQTPPRTSPQSFRSSAVPKRPAPSSSSSHRSTSTQPTKKVKLEPPEPFDAVDVISLLASEHVHSRDNDVVDEDESAYLAQLAASASPATSQRSGFSTTTTNITSNAGRPRRD